jgi:hypothetical protein
MAAEPLVDLTGDAPPASKSGPKPGSSSRPKAEKKSPAASLRRTRESKSGEDPKSKAVDALQEWLETKGSQIGIYGVSKMSGVDLNNVAEINYHGMILKPGEMLTFKTPESYILARGIVELSETPALDALVKIIGPAQPYLWGLAAGGVAAIYVMQARVLVKILSAIMQEQHGPIQHQEQPMNPSPNAGPEPGAPSASADSITHPSDSEPQARPIKEVHVPSSGAPSPVEDEAGGDATPARPDMQQSTSGSPPRPDQLPEGFDLAG